MRHKILNVVAILYALLMVNSGLNKFFNYMPMPEDLPEKTMEVMGAFMQIGWLFPLIGIGEVVGGVLFAIPRFRALAAIMLFPIVIGINLHHAMYAPEGMIIALIVLAIDLWAIAENWHKYLPMVKR
ncbi:DoxX family protein [Echinicola strongylocentroti]|uniref:DoxX family protein n=1 Tax=Echinicola strongylocentroti TaxID=1795355 RepID=A0A2Z4IGY9_9BACT|nr:DoxX family membrane protein [Echinicola strongylocentroti]AWW30195.1 DoxX family protein [Echinicola strongylocentroti]